MLSPAVLGLETSTVEVEVDLRAGLPAFSVVGLPDAAVQEARERVRSGLANQAFAVPARRIVANLAPADLRKAGPQYDLPLALATLAASGQMAPAALVGVGAMGELALDGSLRPVAGALAMAEHAARAGWRRLVVPRGNAAEAGLVPGLEVLGPATLRAAVDLLEGRVPSDLPRLDVEAVLAAAPAPSGPTSPRCAGRAPPGVRSRSPPRRPLHPHDRPPGGRQDHARPAPAGDPPAAVHRRGDRRHPHPLGGGAARRRVSARGAAALPRAPPHGVGRRARGRRPAAAPRAR